ncbi:hypothetical protein [Mariprofundus erugo]|uniref:hypothetical protein n=1 Tax=Mariprofundus erugo TaxID=2528639 RepID=UPI00159C59B3|nr:hypothetical protein [Mariprofundus erugo]
MISISLCLCALLAWFAWQRPAAAPVQGSVRIHLPDEVWQAEAARHAQWRVVTRRLVSRASANTLHYRLSQLQLSPIAILRTEEVVLHAFDDARLYASRGEAVAAAVMWRQAGIEVNIIRVNQSLYMVGLGRLYQDRYAELLQQRLDREGRPYRYERRIVPIPTWRFTFAATDMVAARVLWKKLEASGVMMPVMMPEVRFQLLYGSSLATPDEFGRSVQRPQPAASPLSPSAG